MSADNENKDRGLSSREFTGLEKVFFIGLFVLVMLNLLFLHPHHPHFEAEKIPGFWAVFALVVALLMGRIAKGCAHTFLGKDENFYDKNKAR